MKWKALWMILIAPIFLHAGSVSPHSKVDFEKTLPAIVCIANEISHFDRSYGNDPDSYYEYIRPLYEWFWPPEYCHGSGFIISPDGYIVTNEHVIQEATTVMVALQCGSCRLYQAKVIGTDPRMDVAVLKIEPQNDKPLPFLKFADSNRAKLGQTVFLVGSPITSKLESTITVGSISALDRNDFGMNTIEGYIQTDATSNGGNSGGPLINTNGDVLGVLTWGYSHFWGYEGISFVQPSYTIEKAVNQIINSGKVSQGFLGIKFSPEYESVFDKYHFHPINGACVEEVIEDSPAKKAGLQVGDVVIEINDYPIKSPESLRNQVWVLTPGKIIHLKIERGGQILEISARLGSEELADLYCVSTSTKIVM